MALPTDRYQPAYDTIRVDEMELLEKGILARFSEFDLRKLLLFAGWDWDNNIEAGPLQARVLSLIVYLQHMGQLHWLVDMVDKERDGYEIFRTIRDRVTPPLPPRGQAAPATAPPAATAGNGAPVDPWSVVLLDTNQPFLDRTGLRDDCRTVVISGRRPILSVTGGSDTGKSYTARYLAGVSKLVCGGDIAFVTKVVRLDRLNGVQETGAPADIDGLRLADRLALAITDEPLPDYVTQTVNSESETTWAADAAVAIMSRAQESPRRWLVLDGFDRTVLSPRAKALIDSFLAQVAAEGKVRVAMLGYTGDLSWCEGGVLPVQLQLDEFNDLSKLSAHVIHYLLEVQETAARRNRPPYTKEQLVVDVQDVLRRYDPTAPDLGTLEASLTEVGERVLVRG